MIAMQVRCEAKLETLAHEKGARLTFRHLRPAGPGRDLNVEAMIRGSVPSVAPDHFELTLSEEPARLIEVGHVYALSLQLIA